MAVYALLNTKGGVSKSTTAAHLAVHLAGKGKALLVDGDPQESAAAWAAWRRELELSEESPSPVTIRLRGNAIFDEGQEIAKGYDNVVVDAGGRDAPGLRNALLLADVAIVPIGASGLDGAALDDLLQVVNLAKTYNRKLEIKMLLSRIDPRTKDFGKMYEYLKSLELDVLDAKIAERIAFRRSIEAGRVVEETRDDKKAIFEMAQFYEEVVK